MTHTITVYRKHDTWCFTDLARGLTDEPFVEGADRILDRVAAKHADPGEIVTRMRIHFHGHPKESSPLFHVLRRQGRKTRGGYRYRLEGSRMVGWLCPALFCYFDEAPEKIGFKVSVLDTEQAPPCSYSPRPPFASGF